MESMMRDIFEKKNSAFYHFGQLITLGKIPYDDFNNYLIKGFSGRCSGKNMVSKSILEFTNGHPYYTQQLAFTVWDSCDNKLSYEKQIENAVTRLIRIHDIDYERLWQTQNQTDKKVLITLAETKRNILSGPVISKYGLPAPSTVFSCLKRLMSQGYVIKTGSLYELDDPFFAQWIKRRRED